MNPCSLAYYSKCGESLSNLFTRTFVSATSASLRSTAFGLMDAVRAACKLCGFMSPLKNVKNAQLVDVTKSSRSYSTSLNLKKNANN